MHDWYDVVKDLVLPGFVGVASVVVAITSLRIASSAHKLARDSSLRAENLDRLRRREAFGLLIQEYVNARISKQSPREGQPTRRDPDDVFADAEIAIATLDERDRSGARLLLDKLAVDGMNRAGSNYENARAMRVVVESSTALWVADPDPLSH